MVYDFHELPKCRSLDSAEIRFAQDDKPFSCLEFWLACDSGGSCIDSWRGSTASGGFLLLSCNDFAGGANGGEGCAQAADGGGDLWAWAADRDSAGGADVVAGWKASYLHRRRGAGGPGPGDSQVACAGEPRQAGIALRGCRYGDGSGPSRAIQDGQLSLGAGLGSFAFRLERTPVAL